MKFAFFLVFLSPPSIFPQADERLRQMQAEERAKLEAEKAAMLADNSLVQEERQKLVAAIEAREAEMQREAEATAALAAKLCAMESKLLVGGRSIAEVADDQERQLQEQRKAIERHNREQA